MTKTETFAEGVHALPVDVRGACGHRYQYQRTVGTGGMGSVEHVYDVLMQRHVALKVPCLEAKNAAARGEDLWREARLTAQLDHRGIPAVYELLRGSDDAPQGFAMKLVRGCTLLERIDQLGDARLEPPRLWGLIEVLLAVCDTVSFAHQRSILHLDVKPENIMIEPTGDVYLLDWGVAARCGRRSDGRLMPLEINRGARGTMTYMAPEQFESSLRRVDERTDVHGLGGVLCHILSGKPPYHARAGATPDTGNQAALAALAPAHGSRLGSTLARIAARALSANMEERYGSVAALTRVLLRARARSQHETERAAPLRVHTGEAAGPARKPALARARVEALEDGASGEQEVPTMGSEGKVQATLGAIWLFSDLGPREIERLASVASRKRFAAGAVVVRQGDSDGDLYVVIDGLLRVSVRPNDQRELALNLLRKSDVFGELSLVDGRARSATITAVQPSELLLIRRADFMDVLVRSPDLSVRLLTTMAGHVRRLTERVEDLSVLPVSTRLAKKLLEIADLCGTPLDGSSVALPLTLSQQDLAEHVQATRESVNKCLAKWTREAIVYRTQSQIVIRDRARLRELVDDPTTQLCDDHSPGGRPLPIQG